MSIRCHFGNCRRPWPAAGGAGGGRDDRRLDLLLEVIRDEQRIGTGQRRRFVGKQRDRQFFESPLELLRRLVVDFFAAFLVRPPDLNPKGLLPRSRDDHAAVGRRDSRGDDRHLQPPGRLSEREHRRPGVARSADKPADLLDRDERLAVAALDGVSNPLPDRFDLARHLRREHFVGRDADDPTTHARVDPDVDPTHRPILSSVSPIARLYDLSTRSCWRPAVEAATSWHDRDRTVAVPAERLTDSINPPA